MISQKDIAAGLNMSVSTVGNILNGASGYSKETRELVLKTAKEMGYQRNRASIAVNRRRSNLIGMVHFGSFYETARQAAVYLAEAIAEKGYEHIVVDLELSAGNVERTISETVQNRAEGVILIGNTPEVFRPEYLQMLRRARIPVVSLYGETGMDIPLFGDASRHSFFRLVRHLHEVGHRTIIHPAMSASYENSVNGRIIGIERAMDGVGPCYHLSEKEFHASWPILHRKHRREPCALMVRVEHPVREGGGLTAVHQAFATRIIESGRLPDAMMCSNDTAALGVFNAAYLHGIRIPEEMALTGADNNQIAAFPMFSLTSIEMDIRASARQSVEVLFKLLRKEPVSPLRYEYPSRLVLRRSCGRRIKKGAADTLYREVLPLEVASETPIAMQSAPS